MAKKLWILILAALNNEVLIFSMNVLGLMVEVAFCILYLVEFAVNVAIDGEYQAPAWIPYWLHVYRSPSLFQAALFFSYWNVLAFVVRVFYVIY
jgi:hypothetical protein